MAQSRAASPKELILIGAVFAGFGCWIMLIGMGVAPVPGGPESLNAPYWVGFLAGLLFFLAGVAIFVQGVGGANAKGELPAGAPLWMHAAQRSIVIGIFAAFAAIGTWIALAGDPDQFSGSFMGLGFGVILARIAFGFGALLCWIATIGLSVSTVRKLTSVRAQRRAG